MRYGHALAGVVSSSGSRPPPDPLGAGLPGARVLPPIHRILPRHPAEGRETSTARVSGHQVDGAPRVIVCLARNRVCSGAVSDDGQTVAHQAEQRIHLGQGRRAGITLEAVQSGRRPPDLSGEGGLTHATASSYFTENQPDSGADGHVGPSGRQLIGRQGDRVTADRTVRPSELCRGYVPLKAVQTVLAVSGLGTLRAVKGALGVQGERIGRDSWGHALLCTGHSGGPTDHVAALWIWVSRTDTCGKSTDGGRGRHWERRRATSLPRGTG